MLGICRPREAFLVAATGLCPGWANVGSPPEMACCFFAGVIDHVSGRRLAVGFTRPLPAAHLFHYGGTARSHAGSFPPAA